MTLAIEILFIPSSNIIGMSIAIPFPLWIPCAAPEYIYNPTYIKVSVSC